MNKSDLIQTAVVNSGMAPKEIEKAFNSIFRCIGQSLKKGEPVVLVGFGTFAIKERAARTGINPATKQRISIPAKKVIRFKPGKGLEIDSEK